VSSRGCGDGARVGPFVAGLVGSDPKAYRWCVKPETQWYLAEALSDARGRLGIRDDYETKQNQLSHFAGVLAAFRYAGDVTQVEEHLWFRKMLVALGYEPPDPVPPGTAQAIYVGDPAKRPATTRQPDTAPEFIRSQPGPEAELDLHGGRIRVIAVEFYDTEVVVRWRVSPEPDVAVVFAAEMEALEQDLVGLEDWAAAELRDTGRQKLRMMRLYKFGLTDDLGTRFVPKGSGHGGRPHEMSGNARFEPSTPSGASMLTLSWLGLDVPIPIT
jgi:hypothetical protein